MRAAVSALGMAPSLYNNANSADLAEVYRIETNAGDCPAPILAKQAGETGYLWYGQPEALNRLLDGYDARLRSVFEQLFQQMGMPANQIGPQVDALLPQIKAVFNIPLYTDPMPIQYAIDLA